MLLGWHWPRLEVGKLQPVKQIQSTAWFCKSYFIGRAMPVVYILSISIFTLQWQSWLCATETICLQSLKYMLSYPLQEKKKFASILYRCFQWTEQILRNKQTNKKQTRYAIQLSQFIALRVFRLCCRKDKPRWNLTDSQDWGDGVQPTKVAMGTAVGGGGIRGLPWVLSTMIKTCMWRNHQSSGKEFSKTMTLTNVWCVHKTRTDAHC